MALASPQVSVDVVDAVAFVDLAVDRGVAGVPTVVLNDQVAVEGPVPEELLVDFALHAADPAHPAPLVSSVPFLSCGRLEER
jgi:predicted DsbA family dithiol-disulfide isomerase